MRDRIAEVQRRASADVSDLRERIAVLEAQLVRARVTMVAVRSALLLLFLG